MILLRKQKFNLEATNIKIVLVSHVYIITSRKNLTCVDVNFQHAALAGRGCASLSESKYATVHCMGSSRIRSRAVFKGLMEITKYFSISHNLLVREKLV